MDERRLLLSIEILLSVQIGFVRRKHLSSHHCDASYHFYSHHCSLSHPGAMPHNLIAMLATLKRFTSATIVVTSQSVP